MTETHGYSILRDAAFLLRSVDYGDQHRILSFLTREQGRVDVIAYDAKSSRRRSLGVVDFLHEIDMEYQCSPKNSLHRLLGAELKRSFPNIRRDYDKTMFALSWLKLLNSNLIAGAKIPEIFHVLEQSIAAMETEADAVLVDCVFKKRLLTELGYHLELGSCIRCGTRVGAFRLVLREGGLLCQTCNFAGVGKKVSQPFGTEFWDFGRKSGESGGEVQGILTEAVREFLKF